MYCADLLVAASGLSRGYAAPHAAIVHQQEGLVVVVQTVGVPGRVLDIILSGETALQGEESRDRL